MFRRTTPSITFRCSPEDEGVIAPPVPTCGCIPLVPQAARNRRGAAFEQRHGPHDQALHALARCDGRRLDPAARRHSAARDRGWRHARRRGMGFRPHHGQQPWHAPSAREPQGRPPALQVSQPLDDRDAAGVELLVRKPAQPPQRHLRGAGRRRRYRHLPRADPLPLLRHRQGWTLHHRKGIPAGAVNSLQARQRCHSRRHPRRNPRRGRRPRKSAAQHAGHGRMVPHHGARIAQ